MVGWLVFFFRVIDGWLVGSFFFSALSRAQGPGGGGASVFEKYTKTNEKTHYITRNKKNEMAHGLPARFFSSALLMVGWLVGSVFFSALLKVGWLVGWLVFFSPRY